jgi:hypothetical protein
MKAKYILLVALCAIVTLSFSFVSVNKAGKAAPTAEVNAAPVGGITMGDDL